MLKKGPTSTYAATGHPIMIRAIAGLTRANTGGIYRIPPNTPVFVKQNVEEKLSDGSTVAVGYTELPDGGIHTDYSCLGISVTGVDATKESGVGIRLFTVCVWGPAIINKLPAVATVCIGQTLFISSSNTRRDDQYDKPHHNHQSMSEISNTAGIGSRKIMLLNRQDSTFGADGGLIFLCGI